MEKQVVVFSESEPKKHSIRYKTKDSEAAVSDIYLRRTVLGSSKWPGKLRVTIEEVE